MASRQVMQIKLLSLLLLAGGLFISSVSAQPAPLKSGPPTGTLPGGRQLNLQLETFHLRTNFVVGLIETGKEVPQQIALKVERVASEGEDPHQQITRLLSEPNPDHAKIRALMESAAKPKWPDRGQLQWRPFTNMLPIDLGPGDGQRTIWLYGRWGEGAAYEQHGSGTHVEVVTSPPNIVITNPPGSMVSQPMIQLQGYSIQPLDQIRYELVNARGQRRSGEGLVNDTVTDLSTVSLRSTNFFTCYDLDLAPGTNQIVLRCQDYAGNWGTNTYTYVFTTGRDRTPPKIALEYPHHGQTLSSDYFTARGKLDDPTALITGTIIAAGRTNVVQGLVERNGYFWLESLPLAPGKNQLRINALDAAANLASTNIVILRDDTLLTVNTGDIPPDQLWALRTTVTGRVTPANRRVWVNGVEARVQTDGWWIATQVPVVSAGGGSAVFDASCYPAHVQIAPETRLLNSGRSPPDIQIVQGLSSPDMIVLNPTEPACAVFRLRLIGITVKGFTLETSSDLATWHGVLTNFNATALFDYAWTNRVGGDCRYFRVLPIP